MNDIEDTLKQNEAQIAKAQALLSDVDLMREERDRVFEKTGASYQAFVQYMKSDAIPADARAELQAQVAQFEAEFNEEAQQLAGQNQTTSSMPHHKPIPTHRMV